MKIDLTLNKRSRIKSYRELLSSFIDRGFLFFTHAEYFKNGPHDCKAIYLRHDADRNIEIALTMAKIENELGIRSTYYLLPPGDYGETENYYGAIVDNRLVPSARLKEVVLEIAALGHEIGLHNDFVQLSEKLGRDVTSVIVEQIDFFKSIGIHIIGTASHGSEFVKRHGFVNYQIFSECRLSKNVARSVELASGRTLELFDISYKQLGLEYEAYSIKRDTYISDSSGVFSVNKAVFEDVDPVRLAETVLGSKSIVALIHPDWWVIPSAKDRKKSRISRAFSSGLNRFFPSKKKNEELARKIAFLQQNNESLSRSLQLSTKEIGTLRANLETQKEKSRLLYARNIEYANRLNKKIKEK